ncbi:hypothetical protein PISMIDRAFT_400568 [Pisolithus microcarpus 441]|uniref:Uncharacterized protein n=1 Tax=Pisolithus microcarpus 441 TaxID=765257 RepID=A0A0C9Z5V4_9AGAM|nr:hypothetical protein PISMIDRAFT_400568 [Pisolithus microcarpus 441]
MTSLLTSQRVYSAITCSCQAADVESQVVLPGYLASQSPHPHIRGCIDSAVPPKGGIVGKLKKLYSTTVCTHVLCISIADSLDYGRTNASHRSGILPVLRSHAGTRVRCNQMK